MQRCWCTIVSAHIALRSTGHSAACVAGWLLSVCLSDLLADEVCESSSDTADLAQRVHDLAAAVHVRVQHTEKALEISILDDQRLAITTTAKRKAAGRSASRAAEWRGARRSRPRNGRHCWPPHPSHTSPLPPHHVVEVCWGGERIRSNNAGSREKRQSKREATVPPPRKLVVSRVSENALQTDECLKSETRSQTNETDTGM